MKDLKCRWCEFSKRKNGRWLCSQGIDTETLNGDCGKFYCGERDKVNGVSNRRSKCFVCGRPVYSHGADTPIYCIDHRSLAESDEELLNNAPKELMLLLIGGIFLRAREDYIYNADGKRDDAEAFLKGRWAQELSIIGFSVDDAFRVLDSEIDNETRRSDSDSE